MATAVIQEQSYDLQQFVKHLLPLSLRHLSNEIQQFPVHCSLPCASCKSLTRAIPMNATLPACPCNVCSQKIEFDPSRAGETIPCPHCGMETRIFITNRPAVAHHPVNLRPCPDCGREVSLNAASCPHCGARSRAGADRSTIRLAYVFAILIPIVGIILGIILITKNEPSHGAAAIAISIVVGSFFWFLLFGLAAALA